MLRTPPACRSAVLPAPPLLRVTPAAMLRFTAEMTETLPLPVCTLALRSRLPAVVLTSTLPLPPALIRLLTVSAPPLVSVIAPLLPLLIPVMVPVSLTIVSAPRLETRFTLLLPRLPTLRVLLSLRNTPAFRALTRAATVTAAISRLAAPLPMLPAASRRTVAPLIFTTRLAPSSFCASVMAAVLIKLTLAVPASIRPTAIAPPPALSNMLPLKLPIRAAACMVMAPSASKSTVLPKLVTCTLDELLLSSSSPRASKLILPLADDTLAATSRLRGVAVLPLAISILPLAPVLATAPLIRINPSSVVKLRSPLPATVPPSVMPAAPTASAVLSITDMPPLVVLPPLRLPTVV